MLARDYFPLGIASGSSFCNRKQETDLLVENLKAGKHTLLMATRRYGKSSLALHAIKQSGIPCVEMDFYMARNEKIIESYILNGVIEAIGKSVGPVEKLIASIKKYVKKLKPKLDIGASAIKLELTTEPEIDSATNVKEGLLLLECLLEEKQKKIVLLMDEFQNVGVIAKGIGIEGAIRHVAQKTKYLTIIFSGSNRKLLGTMFEDDTRPLYKLCWKLTLGRIAEEDYVKHIQKAARAAWKKDLDIQIIQQIFLLSERHPYYLNKLCDKLWTYFDKKTPTMEDVNSIWKDILEEEKSDAVKEISLLSLGQKSVLFHIAKGHTTLLTSKDTIIELELSSSSILTALDALEEKDMIEKLESGYRIINPVVRYYVLKG